MLIMMEIINDLFRPFWALIIDCHLSQGFFAHSPAFTNNANLGWAGEAFGSSSWLFYVFNYLSGTMGYRY